MTEKTLRERLPIGCPRNKIEFLADEMSKIARDCKEASNKKPLNMLRNAAFLGMPNKTDIMSCHWDTPATLRAVPNSLNYSHHIAAPVCPNWSGETPVGTGEDGDYKLANFWHGWLWGADELKAEAGALNIANMGMKQVLFQVFRPTSNPAAHSKLITPHAYLRLQSGGGKERVRYGIVELDSDGNAIRIVTEKTVTAQGTFVHVEDWQSGFELDMYKQYAFFVERLDIDSAQHTYITGAGVYYGEPGQVPQLEETQVDRDDGLYLKVATNIPDTGFSEGMTFNLPSVPYVNDISRHLIVNIKSINNSKDILTELKITPDLSENTIKLTNITGYHLGRGEYTFDVEAYYSRHNHIHFYALGV